RCVPVRFSCHLTDDRRRPRGAAQPDRRPGRGCSPPHRASRDGRTAQPVPLAASPPLRSPLACSVPERREMDDVEVRHLPGDLPQLFDGGVEDAAGRTLSVPLPDGDLVWPDPGYPQRRPLLRPAFWLSDDPVHGELWCRLRAEHPRSGLWPLLMDETDQPWASGQIAPEPASEIGNYHPEAFMSEVWADWAAQADEDDHDELAPFGRHCPGLAPPGVPLDDPDAMADR